MTTYAVGDLQGCLQPLKQLLAKVDFNPSTDELWSVGDLINRGPESLETLRFCHHLDHSFRMVLGNHDLHLLAVSHNIRPAGKHDTLDDILNAPDRNALLSWLQQQPLLLEDKQSVMVHAGIPPMWDIHQARTYANEMKEVLHCKNKSVEFFKVMYGNEPDTWQDDLEPPMRWRVITNYFTRMRFCSPEGKLELTCKNQPKNPPEGYAPWFHYPSKILPDTNIIFGHWAALQGNPCGANLFPLDTGYIWGGPMRLLNLDTGEYIHQHPS